MIIRIEDFNDHRFNQKVLNQHNCFLVDDLCVEVEIISSHEAIIHQKLDSYQELVDEFRFYSEHIDTFYNEQGEIVAYYEPVKTFMLPISQIQPTQFCVDKNKIEAFKDFVKTNEDIIIPVALIDGTYISLDGHARLKLASILGFNEVKCYEAKTYSTIKDFVDGCKDKNIYQASDLIIYDHETFNKEWQDFCNQIFLKKRLTFL